MTETEQINDIAQQLHTQKRTAYNRGWADAYAMAFELAWQMARASEDLPHCIASLSFMVHGMRQQTQTERITDEAKMNSRKMATKAQTL